MQVLVAESRVLVDLELAVGRHQPTIPGQGQRIDLDGGGVEVPGHRIQLYNQRRQLRLEWAKSGAENQLPDFERQRAPPWIRVKAGNRLWVGLGDLLDLYPTLRAQDEHDVPQVAVEGQPQVELACDLLGGLTPDLLDAKPLDRHPQNLLGDALGVDR